MTARCARSSSIKVRAAGLLLLLAWPVAPSFAQDALQALEQPPAQQATDEISRFCANIADAARDRRYALQAAELKKLQGEVDSRIELLEKKRAEYEEWLARRNSFVAMAEETVIGIYAKMRPDAAAERMAELDADLAAAILMKLDARISSVILNEMELKAAARLTGIMASAARKEDPS